jgi:tRNA (guanine37-N1)-methyltransferase
MSARYDVISLFPEMFGSFLDLGVTRRAFATGQIEVHLHQLRDFADGRYRRVDDRPFGGGPGMVLLAEPLAKAVEFIWQQRASVCPVVLFTPEGATLNQQAVAHWATASGAILVCGRYEGVDQRFVDTYVSHRISLGDFVLSGGEVAAMALLDSIARLQEGVLGDQDSHAMDSFGPRIDGLLDCPHFTRPQVWRDQVVPAPLMSGNHREIEDWRTDQRRSRTNALRPDLLTSRRIP